MTNAKITPVILCGGSGARVWPLSRESFPKQFVPLVENKNLLPLTLERVAQINGSGLSPEVICITAAGNCQERRRRVTPSMTLQSTIYVAPDIGAWSVQPDRRNAAGIRRLLKNDPSCAVSQLTATN